MNFLTAIINALVGFVQRNPLTVLVILILAIAAPALLKGVALFFLYVVMSILILAVALILVFRWRMNKVRRQMEEQFGLKNDMQVSVLARCPEVLVMEEKQEEIMDCINILR